VAIPSAPTSLQRWWVPTGALVLGSLVVLLEACASSWAGRGPRNESGWWSQSSAASSTVVSTGDSAVVSLVSCTDTTCSVTLGGAGSAVEVLGSTIVFGGIRDGRASLRVGTRTVPLSAGGTVRAGQLVLTCTSVTEDTVSFTVSRE
jgi:hypothetical protein